MGERKIFFHSIILLWIDTATHLWCTCELKPCGSETDNGEESAPPGEWGIPGCTGPVREERSFGNRKKPDLVKLPWHQHQFRSKCISSSNNGGRWFVALCNSIGTGPVSGLRSLIMLLGCRCKGGEIPMYLLTLSPAPLKEDVCHCLTL